MILGEWGNTVSSAFSPSVLCGGRFSGTKRFWEFRGVSLLETDATDADSPSGRGSISSVHPCTEVAVFLTKFKNF